MGNLQEVKNALNAEHVWCEAREVGAAIVTHEVVVKVLIAHVLGVPSIYRRIEVDNASLSLIRVTNKPQLVRLNDTSYLEG